MTISKFLSTAAIIFSLTILGAEAKPPAGSSDASNHVNKGVELAQPSANSASLAGSSRCAVASYRPEWARVAQEDETATWFPRRGFLASLPGHPVL